MENPKITIKHVHGGEDKFYLQHCYFKEKKDTNEFHFFQKGGAPIHTDPTPITSGEKFSFDLPGDDGKPRHFEVIGWFSKDKAHGDWWARTLNDEDDGDPETGTFQASGGHPEELSAGASTSA